LVYVFISVTCIRIIGIGSGTFHHFAKLQVKDGRKRPSKLHQLIDDVSVEIVPISMR